MMGIDYTLNIALMMDRDYTLNIALMMDIYEGQVDILKSVMHFSTFYQN